MRIIAIALNTFKETIRDKILYNLLIFALIMIGSSVLLERLTLGERTKITVDLGLASISLFGALIAIFIGIGLVYKEIERKTIYTIVSKPIARYKFILGKFLGLLLTLLVNIAIMSIVFIIVLYALRSYHHVGVPLDLIGILKAIFLIFLELILLTSIALFFSTFSTPTLSAIFSLSFYVIGHLSTDLKFFGSRSESVFVQKLSSFFYYLLPNLENFNIKAQAAYSLPVDPEYIALVTGYGALYTTIVLLLTTVIFQRRDFK
ncbi:MAG: ABC transporter permease subunit [Deltaproteobacteria bacterium]|nr:MAG: ABC transporter permease subunit [Deltaproteobacteria bacterium]